MKRLILTAIAILSASSSSADMYLNSSESMCDGSDASVVLCDDFEDGVWYATNCDTSGGRDNAANDGWCGNIFSGIDPANAIQCSGGGVNGTDCAAHGGEHDGSSGGVHMAEHRFLNGKEDELYIRWYYKAESGYLWGAEKNMNPTDINGGIFFANIQINCGAGSASSTGAIYFQLPYEDVCSYAGITLSSNKWYFFEMHIVLNTPETTADGVLQLWVDDCGTDGTSCTGSPTLRFNRSNVAFDREQALCSSSPCQLGMVWLENWANPGSTGIAYWDQIVVATDGPIGFMDEGAPGGSTPTLQGVSISGGGIN